MQLEIFKACERGTADYGWLKPNYYFSFSNYFRPDRVRFGALRVLNDDYIAVGGEFPFHPHENMEIVTIPITGSLQHTDDTGGHGIVSTGDVQIMSAGTGITHAEANASEDFPVTLFQIWVLPKISNIAPRYNQRRFDNKYAIEQWQIQVSPAAEDNALWINQDARFAQTNLMINSTITWQNRFAGNGIFVVAVEGTVQIGDVVLERRDAAAITGTDTIEFFAKDYCRILVIEVPML